MPAYICVTHALSRREETDAFCRGLSRYGFRFASIHEQTDPQHRVETLTGASLLIALTCPAAEAAETVASDIRRALGRGMPVLCVSMSENVLDDRFCSPEGGAALIPAPATDTPDRRTVALFIHRLFIRHLARQEACFSAIRCVEDSYGRAIAAAVLAHKGDASACYALGRAYEEGEGVPKLEVEAARWIAPAAEGGIPDARIRMGELYLMGRGTDRNPEAAFRLFEEASRGGDLRGDYFMGLCYLRGLGVLKDPERACECLRFASDGGYPPASYQLGLLYRDGIGVSRNYRTAISLLYHACVCGAETEESATLFPLSLLGTRTGKNVSCVTMRQLRRTRLKDRLSSRVSSTGEHFRDEMAVGCFSRNRVTSIRMPEDGWLASVIEKAKATDPAWDIYAEEDTASSDLFPFSVSLVAVALGQMLAKGDTSVGSLPHLTRALVWYRYALRLGNTDAAYHLGEAYRRGYGVPADPKRAFALFELSAARKDEKGFFALGVCYEQGIGTAFDLHQAFLNYEQAALAGYAPAENNLGGCYEHGWGVVRDMTAATEWYVRAATQGLPEAACRLGLCYEHGRGVEADMAKAIRFYETAVEGGDPRRPAGHSAQTEAAHRAGACLAQSQHGPQLL
jgi:TPR repeat protein